MHRRLSLLKTATAAALTGSLATACVVTPPRVVVAPPRAAYATEVIVASPPAPVVEVVGVAPAPGYVWIRGYWNWVGGRHVWVNGYWTAPPHAGAHWVPHEWVRVDGGYRLRDGHWDRR